MLDDVNKAMRDNLRVMRSLRAVGAQIQRIPELAAEYYANGGPGVGQAVVLDRFQGQGNARFAPLSKDYFDWKSGKSKDLNKKQKVRYGKGSRLLKVEVSSRMTLDKSGTMVKKSKFASILPILVLSGALRAAVAARRHYISSLRGMGDTAFVTFIGLPEYALAHHDPKKAGRVRRSPVSANAEDIKRLKEFVQRRVALMTAKFNSGPVTFGDGQARIIP
jgi:hypothetical protein